MKIFKLPLIILAVLFLSSCGDALKYRKVDANEFPPDPKLRIKKNMVYIFKVEFVRLIKILIITSLIAQIN